MIISKRIAVSLAAAALLATADAAWAETLNYTVLRDGKRIGSHAVSIDAKGPMTQISTTTDIEVKVLFVTAYQFKHKGQELWSGGKLVSLTSATNDDGTDKKLSVKASQGQMTVDSTVTGQERRQNVDGAMLTGSLWNKDVVTQSALLNTLDGQVMKIEVKDVGAETVDAGGKSVTAHHYAISGELTREVWYDDAGRLVRMRFPDKTNSEIIYALD